jgi:hypothetical protein
MEFTKLQSQSIDTNITVAGIVTAITFSGNIVGTSATFTDRVGIGTTNPTQKLDVNGGIRIRGGLYDSSNQLGVANEILISTGTGIDWTDRINAKTIYETVKNVSGAPIAKGTPVYQVGMSGNSVTVGLARADDPNKSAIGVMDETIADEAEGRMLILGEIKGVNTESFNIGDKVYLGETGGYTNVTPTASGTFIQFLGVVFRVDANNGSGYITGTLAEDQIKYQSGNFYGWTGTSWELIKENYWVKTTVGIHTLDNVGIGTTNPTSKLTVSGNGLFTGIVTASSFSGNASSATYATSSGIATSVIGGIGSITQLHVTGISTFTNGPILIGSGTSTGTATQRLQVTGNAYISGNLGIGTTNPTQELDVNGDIRIRGSLYDSNNNVGAAGSILTSTGSLIRWTTQTTEMDITSSLFT